MTSVCNGSQLAESSEGKKKKGGGHIIANLDHSDRSACRMNGALDDQNTHETAVMNVPLPAM